MARYIVTGSYTAAAMKGLLAKPSDREAATSALVAAAGGKLHSFYLTTGDCDFMMITETDNLQDMLAALIVAGASGAVSGLKTVQAFSSAEFTAAQKRAGEIAQKYMAPA
ncbi:MAG: GYD domain-containing protein [Pseudomonadota bacterium]|uniref:GYD domain-containing protein n=1 Tax=Tabrizicola sp. TaxID=2005166 RepID=UPI0025F7B6AD|nr:GYD domain-containing protein [Tabrizicola sp.]